MLTKKTKILIIEDVLSNRLVLENMLKPYGDLHACESGEAGLELFQSEFESGEPFELVIVDVSLPGIDGIEVVQSIRFFESGNGLDDQEGVSILVVTSSDDPIVRERVAECGANSFLTKPVSLEMLQSVLKDLM